MGLSVVRTTTRVKTSALSLILLVDVKPRQHLLDVFDCVANVIDAHIDMYKLHSNSRAK